MTTKGMKMNEDQNSPVEKPDETSGSEGSERKEDLVPYSTYKKALNEKKNTQAEIESYREKMQEYQSKLKQFEDEKLQSEGRKDELLEKYKKEADDLRNSLTKREKEFAWNTVRSKVREAALQENCKNPDKLIRLLDDEDWKSLQVGEDYSVDNESLKNLMQKARQENDFLFKKNVAVADGNPSQKPQVKPKSEKDIFSSYITNMYKE